MAMPRLAHCTWIAFAHGTRLTLTHLALSASCLKLMSISIFLRCLETAGRTEDKDNSAFSAAVWAAEVQRVLECHI